MKIVVKLKNKKYCIGCPCKVELFSQAFCLLYKIELKFDYECNDTKNFMKTVRLKKCIGDYD